MIEVVTTRRGHPAVWEEGGAGRNTGDAVIVCGPSRCAAVGTCHAPGTPCSGCSQAL